jgi:hypothetical protein
VTVYKKCRLTNFLASCHVADAEGKSWQSCFCLAELPGRGLRVVYVLWFALFLMCLDHPNQGVNLLGGDRIERRAVVQVLQDFAIEDFVGTSCYVAAEPDIACGRPIQFASGLVEVIPLTAFKECLIVVTSRGLNFPNANLLRFLTCSAKHMRQR